MAKARSLLHPSTKGYPLKNVYFMIRCTREDHRDCSDVSYEAFVSYPGIMESGACRVLPGLGRFCVSGKALVLEKDLAGFERALKRIRTRAPERAGVAELEVLVSQ